MALTKEQFMRAYNSAGDQGTLEITVDGDERFIPVRDIISVNDDGIVVADDLEGEDGGAEITNEEDPISLVEMDSISVMDE